MFLQNLYRNAKTLTVMTHDLVTTPLAIILTLYLRYPGNAPIQVEALTWIIPLFTIYAGFAYRFFRLYESKWRFASLPDLFNIFQVASLLAVTLLAVDFALTARGAVTSFAFGEKACLLYWILQMALLGGPHRATRTRAVHPGARAQHGGGNRPSGNRRRHASPVCRAWRALAACFRSRRVDPRRPGARRL
jgi:FlaA1/EpsC-like NDP-sugar epimerase